MFENIRKAILLGMGIAALSWDKIREQVDELVSRGDISVEEGKRLYEELKSRADQEGSALNERIHRQVREALKDMGVADRTQIAILEGRIDALERRIEELRENKQDIED